jgi:hypothetical protein
MRQGPPPRLLLLALVGHAVFAAGDAMAQSQIVIQPARRDTLVAEAGGVVTAAFDVRNARRESVWAAPRIVVPKGWSVIVGGAPFDLSANGRELWLVGVAPTATTAAGTYMIRASLRVADDSTLADSVFVRLPERRGLEVFPGEAPSYTMAGDGYSVTFFVHNRGNVTSTFSLRASTSLGPAPSLQNKSVTVQPGATTIVEGRVSNERAGLGWGTRENVVELLAQDDADSTNTSTVSLHTTIVPRSRRWLDQLSTMPAQLTLRSVGTNSGVSPASLFGSAQLGPGSNTQVDFVFRAPVSGPSLFGERDEYRVAVTADRYRVRLGDNLYGFSQLSSSWTAGFGAEARGEVSGVTAGAYVKENRWTGIPGSERALTVGTSARAPFSVSVIGVDRTGVAGTSARMGTVTSQARLGRSLIEVEDAVSDSAGIGGEAHRARVSGEYSRLSYDASLTRGSPDFAGRDHGQTTGHAGFTATLDGASLTANTSTLSYVPTFDALGFSRVRSTTVEGSFLRDRLSLIYEQANRADSGMFAALGGGQRGGRIRTSLPLGWANLFADVAGGYARRADAEEGRYASASMTLHAPLSGAGSLELFVQRSAGMLFETSGLNAATTALLHLSHSNSLLISAYGNVPAGQTRLYYGQIDAEVGHTLQNGMTLVVRDRLTSSPWRSTAPTSNLMFVELRAPLQIPTGLARSRGMARGRIFDEETGRGVSGVLVRLGPEAAVTDAQGRVAFASLPPGRYHASVDGAAGSRVAADALLTGDVAVDVTADAERTPDFTLSLVRGGQVRVDVRQFDFATTLATSSPDSLVDAGGFGGAMIALIGTRDTIYQVTNQNGIADFRDVPVGRWAVQVIAATLSDAHALESDESAVVVRAGGRTSLGLRVVPKRRAVQFVAPPPVIVAKPVKNPNE